MSYLALEIMDNLYAPFDNCSTIWAETLEAGSSKL